jgi:hypothetical protein
MQTGGDPLDHKSTAEMLSLFTEGERHGTDIESQTFDSQQVAAY